LHCSNGEIYVGYWQRDKRHGFGVATYENKDKYYGMWLQDQRNGTGVYLYRDGTVFRGLYRNDMRRGAGSLLLPNGDTMEGEWKDDEISKAKYIKGTVESVPRCTQDLFQTELQVFLDKTSKDRDKSNANGPNLRIIPFNKWEYYFSPSNFNMKEIERGLRERYSAVESIGTKELSVLFNDAVHPFGRAITEFCDIFNASYHVSYGNERVMLYSAIDDVHLWISKFFLPRLSLNI
jgi:hypothetical protein